MPCDICTPLLMQLIGFGIRLWWDLQCFIALEWVIRISFSLLSNHIYKGSYIHWSARTLKPLTGKMNNSDYPLQCNEMGFCGPSTNWKVGWLIPKISLGKLLNPQIAPKVSIGVYVRMLQSAVWMCVWVNEVLQLYKYQFICQCSDGKILRVAFTWHTLAHPEQAPQCTTLLPTS